ncbi:hypothetical protein Tco_0909561 [Tanacetum coccineum]|uniref:Uncharacterized protein n=1 Tax=Tanacetum coccineum TaxID=301880 RepID=A0ABQ5CQB0_9ASTR
MPTTTTTVTETTTTTTVPPPPPQPQQDVSTSILTQMIGQLEQNIADLVDANQALEERLDKQGNKIHQLETQDLSRLIREQTVEFIDSQEIDRKIKESVKEVVTTTVQHAIRGPLFVLASRSPTSDMKGRFCIKTHVRENYERDKRNQQERLLKHYRNLSLVMKKTPPGSPPPPPHPPPPSGASGASGTTRAFNSSQDPFPPPPSPIPNPDDQSPGSATPGSSKTAATTAYTAWTTTTSRFEPSASSIPEDVFMHEESDFAAQDMVSDDEDIGSRHIPRVNLKQDWFKPLSEDERPATPEPAWSIPSSSLSVPTHNWASAIASSYVPPPENSLLSQTGDIGVFIDWFCKKQGITELTPEHLEGPAYEVVKAFHPDVIHLQYQMEECHKLLTNQVDDRLLRYNVSRPLPLGGPPGHVTIQTEFFFNRDLDYLRFGSKGDRIALSITKMKAAYYPDVGLEQMVPDQMWIEAECMYDISATYGISHWWFRRQKFYIDRHSAETNRRAIVRTHMRILSVVRIEVFLIYGYDYMKKIVLRRADNQEYTIAENDFKNLVIRQRVEDFQLGIESYQTQLNLTKPRWEATGLEFMHDYKILDSPRAVVFRDKYGMQMIMRFNEIHKFSDGTLQQINEALDYRVKDSERLKSSEGDIFFPELGELCWWKNTRRRLQTSSENRMMISSLTEIELVLEHTQQGTSNEVSVSTEGVEELKRNVKIKGKKKAALLEH